MAYVLSCVESFSDVKRIICAIKVSKEDWHIAYAKLNIVELALGLEKLDDKII